MSAAYVRQHYGVNFKVGDRVTVDGKPGRVVSFPGQYVGVRFDGETTTSRCHPTWELRPESETLCRTCMRPITHETRTEPGYLPREGWYDDARTDPLVCFKAIDYRHVPLAGRERAYYDAGYRAGLDFGGAA